MLLEINESLHPNYPTTSQGTVKREVATGYLALDKVILFDYKIYNRSDFKETIVETLLAATPLPETPKRVLVVDSTPEQRKLWRIAAVKMGVQHHFCGPVSALARVREEFPMAGIILDRDDTYSLLPDIGSLSGFVRGLVNEGFTGSFLCRRQPKGDTDDVWRFYELLGRLPATTFGGNTSIEGYAQDLNWCLAG